MIHYEGLFKIRGGTEDSKFAGILPLPDMTSR